MTRLRWAFADGWTMTQRDLAHWVREPSPVLFGLLFPIMIMLMFAYLFGGSMSVPGGGDYREFLMPGMFGMNMLFGIGATATAVVSDVSRGVTDRFRSMPISPASVLIGRCGADMLNSALVLAVMIACGLAIGWRPHGTLAETALAIGLLLLFRLALVWVGIFLGLALGTPEALVGVQTLEFPIGFLANAFVSPSTMPGWLGAIAEWNPLSSTVSATRELFGNPGWGGESWIAQHGLVMAVVWPLVLLVIFVPLSVRKFQALGR